MDLTKAFEDKLWSSMSSFDLGYVPSMALVMANHQLDGTNYGAERPQNYYQWLLRRFKSWTCIGTFIYALDEKLFLRVYPQSFIKIGLKLGSKWAKCLLA